MTRFSFLGAAAIAAVLGGCTAVPSQDTAAIPASGIAVASSVSDTLPLAPPLPTSSVPAAIPSGFVGFCLRFSDQCDLPKNSAPIAHLDAQTFELLTKVNHHFNTAIQPEDDARHYGPSEYWTIVTDGYGDCEDYALTKRKALIEAGLPVAALRMALVLTSNKEAHAILTVATDRGDFVLDNLNDELKPWTALNYTWLERQDPKQAWRWDMLSANSASSPSAATRIN